MLFAKNTDAVFLKKHLKYGQIRHQKDKSKIKLIARIFPPVKRNH